jgi:predicted component of type VI protein secretion system
MRPATMRLEVVAGNAASATIVVEDELIIGRQADGEGRLGNDDEISRSHARVALDADGSYAIEDLGSTNGTFVNGLRITTPQGLVEGDTIELGSTTLVVREIQPAQAPEPRSQPTLISEALSGAPAEAGAEPSREDTPQPALEEIPQPVPEDIAPSAAEPTIESVLEEIPPPVPEEIPQPVPEDIAEPAPEEIPQPVPEDIAEPAPEDIPLSAAEPTIESVLEEIPEPVADPAGPPPPLAMRIEVDFAARAARILVGDGADPVRLELVDGTWRAVPPVD